MNNEDWLNEGQGKTLEERKEKNIWDNIDELMQVVKASRLGQWSWWRAQNKYLMLRVDMRDGGCVITDEQGNRICPRELLKKGSKVDGKSI